MLLLKTYIQLIIKYTMQLKFLTKKIIITPQNLLLGLYLAILSAYVLVRIFSVSVVHDEAITFFISLKDFSSIFNFSSLGAFAVNNHFLNTFLIKIIELIFDESQFFLRLPALLGFCLYIWFSVKISKLLFVKQWVIWSVIALTLNPFMLDFFSLARGYSLGLGLLMGCLYFFFKTIEKKAEAKTLLYLIICGILSCLANFAFITPFVIILYFRLGILLYDFIKNKKTRNLKITILTVAIPAIVTPILLYTLLGPQLLFLKKAGLLYAGGNTGFFTDTVLSLIKASLYNEIYSSVISYLPLVLISLIFTVGLGLIIFIYKEKSKLEIKNVLYIFSILILLFILSQIQHLIFKTPFVTDRTALYFIPFVMLLLVLICKTLFSTIKENYKLYLQATCLTLMFCLCINFLLSANFSYTYVWTYDSDTKNIVEDIGLIHQATPQTSLRVWNNWKLEPSINFLKHTQNIAWLQWAYRVPPTDSYNVYVLLPEDYSLLQAYSLQVVKKYKNSEVILAIKSSNVKPTSPSPEH